jgi:hypothetical protein
MIVRGKLELRLSPSRLIGHSFTWHCQSKFVYFAKTSKPDFAAIDFPEFLPVDLSGPLAAPSI